MKIIMISARRRYASEQPPVGRLLASRRRISVIFLFENYRNGTAAAAAYRAQPPEGRLLARSCAVRQCQPNKTKGFY